MMNRVHKLKFTYLSVFCRLQIWRDEHGQDLIEYALMAGFVAVAAGAIMPGVSTSISKIFSKVASVMTVAASSGAAHRQEVRAGTLDRRLLLH